MRGVFIGQQLLTATAVGLGVFRGLPLRYWPVDMGAGLIVLSAILCAFALAGSPAWERTVVRVVAIAQLGAGCTLLVLLGSGVAALRATYGPLGQGGVLVYFLLMVLLLPYLIVAPALLLLWVGPKAAKGADPAADPS
jgi:hypothetical protein